MLRRWIRECAKQLGVSKLTLPSTPHVKWLWCANPRKHYAQTWHDLQGDQSCCASWLVQNLPLQWIGTCSRFRCSGWWFTILESWIVGRFLGSITKALTTLNIDSPHEKQRTKEGRCRDLDARITFLACKVIQSIQSSNKYLPNFSWSPPRNPSQGFKPPEIIQILSLRRIADWSWSLRGCFTGVPWWVHIHTTRFVQDCYVFEVICVHIWHIMISNMDSSSAYVPWIYESLACTVYHELSWIFAVWAYLSENHRMFDHNSINDSPPHLPHGLPKVATSRKIVVDTWTVRGIVLVEKGRFPPLCIFHKEYH